MWISTLAYSRIFKPAGVTIYTLTFKAWSHRANGRVTDKTSLYPFVSVGIRFMSVPYPVNPLLVRRCPVMSVPSVGKFWACSKLSTGQNGLRRPFDVRSLSISIRFVRNSCVTSPVLIRFIPFKSGGPRPRPDFYRTTTGPSTDKPEPSGHQPHSQRTTPGN